MAFSPDANTVLTGGKDYIARRWDTCTGQPIANKGKSFPCWRCGLANKRLVRSA